VVACEPRAAPGTNTLKTWITPVSASIAVMKYTNGPTTMRSTSVVSP
jgi:hypothetical protein